MQGCDFEPAKDIDAFAAYKDRLKTENPDWSPDFLHKQALIVFNEEMYPLQVRSFFGEKNGDSGTSTGQIFQIMNGRLVNQHYDFFKMIDHATSEEEKNSMREFQDKAVAAKTGEKIYVLDLSALGKGGGVKYLDVYEKESESLIRHKERVDLAGDGKDLSYVEAKEFLVKLDTPDVQPLVGQFQAGPEIQFTEPTTSESLVPITSFAAKPAETVLKPEIRLSIPATTDFWFEVMTAAAPTITETQAPEYVIENTSGSEPEVLEIQETDEIVPTRTDPVGLSETKRVASASINPEGKPKISVSRKLPAETPTRTVPVGVQEVELPSGFHLENPKTAELVPTKTVYIVVPKREDQPTGTVLVGRKQEQGVSKVPQDHPGIRGASGVTIKPTRSHLEGRVLYQRKESREIVSRLHGGTEAILPPLWQVKLEPLNDKEIPIWPRGRGGFDYLENNDALVLVVVTTFFLIANTTWVQRDDVFLDFRGSG